MSTDKDPEAWYRNHLVWLVIAIPALTVLGCMLTIYIAISNPDTLVSDSQAAQASNEVRSAEPE